MTAPGRRFHDIGEVSRMLASRIHVLAQELLPGGKRCGHEWMAGSLAGEAGTRLGVHLSGSRAGVWKYFAGTGDEQGDALDLVAHVLFGGDKRQALAWSVRWLGLESGDPNALQTARRAVASREEAEAKTAEEIENTRAAARRIWFSASPICLDTPVDRYLRGRGIPLRELGRQPGAIRFHQGLWHVESRRHWPAMVTAVSGNVPGGFMACHRTWLEVQSDGRVTKAPLEDNKRTLGSFKGGHISLWRGASGKPLAQAPAGETADITEGIEDGLSVAYAAPECRVLAAVTLGNWAAMVLPGAITAVRLWKQNDIKPQPIAAFDKVLRSFLAQGRYVTIAEIPRGIKDVNDLLRAENG